MSGADYRSVVRVGLRLRGKHFLVHAVPMQGGTAARFGFVIPKTVGNAVKRNRLRRQYKAISLELLRSGITPGDYVIRAKTAESLQPFHYMREDLFALFESANLLTPGWTIQK